MGLTVNGLLSAALVVDILALTLAGRAYYLIRGSEHAKDSE